MEQAPSGRGPDAIKGKYRDGSQQYDKNNGVAAYYGTCIHKGPGKTGHFRAKLDKYLIEYGHHLYQKDDDHQRHHGYHDHRVSDGITDTFADGIFPGVMALQGGHHTVKSTGLLTNLDHMEHVRGIKLQGIHGLIQASGFLHIAKERIKHFLFIGRRGILLHDGKSFQR